MAQAVATGGALAYMAFDKRKQRKKMSREQDRQTQAALNQEAELKAARDKAGKDRQRISNLSQARRAALLSGGSRRSTILTSPLGITGGDTGQKKVLLGQ